MGLEESHPRWKKEQACFESFETIVRFTTAFIVSLATALLKVISFKPLRYRFVDWWRDHLAYQGIPRSGQVVYRSCAQDSPTVARLTSCSKRAVASSSYQATDMCISHVVCCIRGDANEGLDGYRLGYAKNNIMAVSKGVYAEDVLC
jgi:hypothetical protein